MTLASLSFLLVNIFSILSGVALVGSGIPLVAAASPVSMNNGNIIVDNEASIIEYHGNWTIMINDAYSGGSSSYSTTPGDSFTLHFNGSSIDYHGTAMTNGAKFSVHLDGTHVGTCTTAVSNNTTPTSAILWATNGLSPSVEHVLQVVHNDTLGKQLSVDDIVFIATGPVPTSLLADQGIATASSSPSPTTTPVPRKSHKNTGAIVGGVFGGTIALALIILAMVFFIRRKKTRNGAGYNTRPFSRLGYSNSAGGVLGGLGAKVTGAWTGGWKRGSGRSGDTGTTVYDEDTKVAVPHLYNSYASGTAKTHQMSYFNDSAIGAHNSLSSTGPAVPYQIPFPTDAQASPIHTHSRSQSQNKALPAIPGQTSPNQASPSREVDFTSHVTGGVYSHPYSSGYVAGGGGGFKSSGTGGYHPYAPYAQDYRRASVSSRPSYDEQGGSNKYGSTGSLQLNRGIDTSRTYSEDYRGDISLSRQMSASGASDQGSLGPSLNKHSIHPMAAATSNNNSTNSLSFYPDATSADGLARSYQPTVMTRPESRASSVSSKRFSNQLFTR